MKVKDEILPEGGRRRSGRLAKVRGNKKSVNQEDEDETPNNNIPPTHSATSSQPSSSPSALSPASDQLTNGENANPTNCVPHPVVSNVQKVISIPKETEPTPPFTKIEENVYLFERKKSRNHKDIRKMVCDCVLTKEERQRGLTGCGDDCLNRILMIECGSRCPLNNDCANKRFQKKQYAKVEPFRAGKKGWGLRVLERVESGSFIMEYIGEVVDPSEFKSRVRKCAKEKKEHHYFMALKSDEIIDATFKGNVTRFVNHSCEPSCETQKWTVNGDLRIGFFAIRTMEPGDEVTFNYQYERYGKKAQPCFCETPSCVGVIGGTGTSTIAIDGTRFTTEELEDIKGYDATLEEDEDAFEDFALEAEIDKLCSAGSLKNKRQAMTLARLMVRAEDPMDRMKLLKFINANTQQVFRRLFLDYHGLQLLWSWMVETEDPAIKAGILQVLSILPIPNRTVLTDSRVWDVVERWSKEPDPVVAEKKELSLPPIAPPPEPIIETPVKIEGIEEPVKTDEVLPKQDNFTPEMKAEEQNKEETLESKPVEPVNEVPVVDDLSGFQEETSTPVVERATKIKITIISKKEEAPKEPPKDPPSEPPPNIGLLARKLLHMWKDLKEAYKIPRLIRAKREEDELAADALEKAENTAQEQSPAQEKKTQPETKPSRPYDWVMATIRKPNEKLVENMMNTHNEEQMYANDNFNVNESKVTHRLQFELGIMKERYEQEMETYRAQLAMYEQHYPPHHLHPPGHVPPPPFMPPYPPQEPFLEPPVQPYFSEIEAVHDSYHLTEPQYIPETYHEEHALESEPEWYGPEFPEINTSQWTVDNLANVIIECTPRDGHSLRPDKEAIVSADYGVEFVPIKKRKTCRRHSDDQPPDAGVYFNYGDSTIYFTPHFLTTDDYPSDFYGSYLDSSKLPNPCLVNECGPLHKNWRRATDPVTGHSYFFHKKHRIAKWKLPEKKRKNKQTNDELSAEIKPKIESVVATADSTSTPVGTNTAVTSPSTSMASPPGIFYQPPVNGSNTDSNAPKDPRQRVSTPDQSNNRKSSSRKKKPNFEKFKGEISELVKKCLYSYQKPDCKQGKITTNEDFKFLAKKFTNEIYAKEVKSGKTDLVVNDVVKKKAKGYVKKYMATRGSIFKISQSPNQVPGNTMVSNDEETQEELETNEETEVACPS